MVVIGCFDSHMKAATDRGPLRSRKTRLDSPLVARKGHFFMCASSLCFQKAFDRTYWAVSSRHTDSARISPALMPGQPAGHVRLVQQAHHLALVQYR